jgi:hypothetical protein
MQFPRMRIEIAFHPDLLPHFDAACLTLSVWGEFHSAVATIETIRIESCSS